MKSPPDVATTMLEGLRKEPRSRIALLWAIQKRWSALQRKPPARAAVFRVFDELVRTQQIVPAGTYGPIKVFRLGSKSPVAPLVHPLPDERCFFLTNVARPFAAARRAIEGRFEVFAKTRASVSFRWRHTKTVAGPEFRLEASTIAAAGGYLRAPQRRKLAAFDGCLVLAFDDLDAVLDEINGLIEAQAVIGEVTKGPIIRGWKRTLDEI